jgi:hypothetical protein
MGYQSQGRVRAGAAQGEGSAKTEAAQKITIGMNPVIGLSIFLSEVLPKDNVALAAMATMTA